MITCPFCEKTHNQFYLVDVKSTININGKDIAFDYINTYLDLNKAITEAKVLTENDDVLSVSVHRWTINNDGTQEHAEDDCINGIFRSCIPYSYTNKNHREMEE